MENKIRDSSIIDIGNISNFFVMSNEDEYNVEDTDQPLASVMYIKDLELWNLLEKWNLPHLKAVFADNQIDLECLKYITEKDIESILQAFGIADKIKFRGRLAEWRIEQGLSVVSVAETITATSSFNEEIKKCVQNCTTQAASPSHNSRDSSPAVQLSVETINIDQILLSSPKGVDVTNSYKRKNILDKNTRNQLIACVVDYLVYNKLHMSTKDALMLAEKIVIRFPGEAKESYFIPGDVNGRARGALYTKYNNTIKFLRSKNIVSPARRRRSRSPISITSAIGEYARFPEERTVPEELLDKSPECESNKTWQHVADPWEIVEIKWRDTFGLRREEILKKPKVLAHEIFCDWPLLTQEKAPRLIDLDFIALYSASKSMLLLNKWDGFLKKCVPILKNQLKSNKSTKEILNQINNCPYNSNVFTSAVLKLLHYVLPPSRRIKVSVKPNKTDWWHPSIQASIDSVLLQVKTHAEIKIRYNQHKAKYKELKLTCQPVIVSIEDIEFFVVSDNIFHKTSSMVTAIDTVFKLFFVLNLECPTESTNVWRFLQIYIYEIILDSDKNLSSATTSFITQLDSEENN